MENLTEFLGGIWEDAMLLAANNSDIVGCMTHLCVERHSHLLANCLDVSNGDIKECLWYFDAMKKAYEVSGFGESILISFLERKFDATTMHHLIWAAQQPEIAQLRKERAIAQKGSPFCPTLRSRFENGGRNIFGRPIGGRSDRRDRRKRK
jgi:hypothetical protein